MGRPEGKPVVAGQSVELGEVKTDAELLTPLFVRSLSEGRRALLYRLAYRSPAADGMCINTIIKYNIFIF